MDTPDSVTTVPNEYRTVTPWIISEDSAKLIDFLETAFDAEEIDGSRMVNENGIIEHVEVKIGDSIIMMFDSHDSWPETPTFLRLYLEDADKTYEKALNAGATSVTEMTELFWGDRVGRISDPLGNIWWLQTHVANIPDEEMEVRMQDDTMIEGMKYVQQSLTDELNSRK